MSGTVYLEREDGCAVLVIDNPPVNAGSADIRRALLARIAEVEGDPELRAGVLIGAGKSFIAGSDLREFDLPLDPPQLPEVIEAIEGSAKPWVAAIHGVAFGGGYELSLGCDARIATKNAKVGLPECQLGILPGAGGTQKLPRLIGRVAAISLICSGRRVAAPEALSLGMIDALATEDLRAEAVALALSRVGHKARVIDRAVPSDPAEKIEAARKSALRAGRGLPHIAAAIDHILAAGEVPAAEGLADERAAFQALRVAPEARALRHIFFAETEARRSPARDVRPRRRIDSVGVVGSGTMGVGIALALLQGGLCATVVDSDPAALERGRAAIEADIARGEAAGRTSPDVAAAMRAQLTLAGDLGALAKCDLVIEAVIEDLEVKRAVFAELSRVLSPEAVLATNTSYLDIDAIAEAVHGAERFLGLHFFSPAHRMKLLEVVTGAASDPETVAAGFALASFLGKQPVLAGNAFGFIGNRIYAAYRAACEFMLEDGAMPEEVDAAMTAFGFAMGPFAVADMSGLDIAWRMRKSGVAARHAPSRYVHIPDRLCEAGRLGRKTGAGYYRYDEDGVAQPDPDVARITLAASAQKGIERRPLNSEEIQLRALGAIVNEAALVLAEGVATRPGDIDVALVNGYGFPRWKGGPVHWARQQPVELLVAACAEAVSCAGVGKRLGDLFATGLLERP